MLIDQAIIHVKSGKGGDGKVAFRREKYIPKGGPAGGDGGKGGDVWLLADSQVDTLLDFAGVHHWSAQNGGDGGAKQCTGVNGDDLILKLAPGTLVFDLDTGKLVTDMNVPGKRFRIARGGRGGFGNEHFKSPTNQAPRTATQGEPGILRNLRLELKLIADIGFVGKPNAGKSTLLASVSQAHPKIADYPFTTLEPQLGIAELPGNRRMVMADLPGLIQGAAQGAGLGHRFLRHIERTRLLVHLVEIEATDGSDPAENYRVIRQELEAYSPTLAAKPEIIVLSKMDLLGDASDTAAARQMVQEALGKEMLKGRSMLCISSASGQGVTELLEVCWSHLQEIRAAEKPPTPVAAEVIDTDGVIDTDDGIDADTESRAQTTLDDTP